MALRRSDNKINMTNGMTSRPSFNVQVLLLSRASRYDRTGFVNVSCGGEEFSLDECTITEMSSCHSKYIYDRRSYESGTVRVTCGTNSITAPPPSRPRKCHSITQSKTAIRSSSADCEKLRWFICEAKPEILHDIHR